MHRYDAADFTRRMDAALARIRTLLDNTRHPQYPAEVPHRYEDKYLLAEMLTRAAMAGLHQCLENVGLTPEDLARLRQWAATRSVTLRLDAQEDCTFEREETREVESPHKHVTEVRSGGRKTTISDKVVTTVTEYWWVFDFRYQITAFPGPASKDGVRLVWRAGRIRLMTTTKTPPRPRSVIRPPVDANVTWLFQHVDGSSRLAFAIDRSDPDCHTPRRNPDVEGALTVLLELARWCAKVESYFLRELFPVQQEHDLDLRALTTGELFSPVVPLFAGDGRGGPAASPTAGAQPGSTQAGDQPGAGDPGGVVPFAWVSTFLEEQRRALGVKCQALAQAFPADDSIITAQEACLLVTLMHAREVCRDLADGVDHIEAMLREQLIAAIGKEVGPSDFADYMTWHHRRLFRPAYRPQPFSFAVRRPDHDPEGTVVLEARAGRPMPAPISTLVKSGQAPAPMRFPLDAATQVSFLGERHLHAWVSHEFSGDSGQSLTLVARARQFSSFILMIGRITSADTFEPRHAVIVQNKDVLEIPLLLEQIPTPKEFRDAIESLSPEQQRFAKAFRGMQLESTLFGMCVVQIKPQLERLLRLPPDSLTKEIELSQDLLQLFMEHQIPSDLLSWDGPAEAPQAEKLARVSELVARMRALIDKAKRRELGDARQQEAFRRAEANMTPADPFGDPFSGLDVRDDLCRAADPFGAPPPGAAPFASGPNPFAGPDPFSPSASGMMMAAPATRSAARPSAPVPSAPPPAPSPIGAAAPPPPPTPPPTTTPASSEPTPPREPTTTLPEGDAGAGVDYTRIPAQLDRRLEELDEDDALRPTIINPDDVWTRTRRKSLLAEPEEEDLDTDEQRTEKDKAFDLMDALSKSGSIPFEHASLHVVIAATHCFDDTLLETVIQGNVNPIERVEVSSLIVASTIHAAPAVELLMDDQRQRILANAPRLADDGDAPRLPDQERRG